MRMRKILSIVLVTLLLASAVPLAVTPAGAQQAGIPFAGEDNELTKEELVNAILPYMLDEGNHKLDDVGDAAWAYAYWDGKPKTIVDSASMKPGDKEGAIHGRETTMYRPIERLVITQRFAIDQLRAIKVPKDLIVGAPSYTKGQYQFYYDDFKDVEGVSTNDLESILILNPDAVMVSYYTPGRDQNLMDVLESADIAVFCFACGLSSSYMFGFDFHPKEITKLGYLFDKESEAEEYRDWYESVVCSIVEETEKIPEADRPKVYLESYRKQYYTFDRGNFIGAAGGKNIIEKRVGDVDHEAVPDRNPEFIIKMASGGGVITGYSLDVGDMTEVKKLRDEIMSRSELQNVTAVKNGTVYVMSQYFAAGQGYSGPRGFFAIVYMAKWFQPDLFEDLDPTALHQEFLTRFQGLDIDLDKQGVFVYHPTEHPDGN